ncbi:hypothetical protein JCM16418A_16330 [Paenibacillus pini]
MGLKLDKDWNSNHDKLNETLKKIHKFQLVYKRKEEMNAKVNYKAKWNIG